MISVQLLDYFRASGTSFQDLCESLRLPGQGNALEEIVERAVGRGELDGRPRRARAINLPFDLLRNEILMTMKPLPDESMTEIVDDVWLPLLRR